MTTRETVAAPVPERVGDDMVWTTRAEAETEAVGSALARRFEEQGTTLLLRGEMGVGKTVLVRGLSTPLGIDRREVLSPTYNLIHEYDGESGRLVHVDLYRLEPEDLDSLGLDELLAGPGLKAVEWAERLPWEVPDAETVEIVSRGREVREIRLLDAAADPSVGA